MAIVEVLVSLIPKARYEATFTVTDSETGAAVPGASVVCGALSGATGTDGTTTLGSFRAGVHDFTVAHADYEDFSGSFTAG